MMPCARQRSTASAAELRRRHVQAHALPIELGISVRPSRPHGRKHLRRSSEHAR